VDFPAGMAGLWEETQPTNILIKIDHGSQVQLFPQLLYTGWLPLLFRSRLYYNGPSTKGWAHLSMGLKP